MSKQHYALKLNASRPDFVQTMTDEERAIMMDHIAFWQPYLADGTMIVFGPVLDPKGPYGFAVVAVDNEDEVKRLIAADPASKINHYEYHPMKAIVGGK